MLPKRRRQQQYIDKNNYTLQHNFPFYIYCMCIVFFYSRLSINSHIYFSEFFFISSTTVYSNVSVLVLIATNTLWNVCRNWSLLGYTWLKLVNLVSLHKNFFKFACKSFQIFQAYEIAKILKILLKNEELKNVAKIMNNYFDFREFFIWRISIYINK